MKKNCEGKNLVLNQDLQEFLNAAPSVIYPKSREELFALAFGEENASKFDVSYDVENMGKVTEATIVRCKNGAVVNYHEDYMRRRDPDCLLVADKKETDKPHYKDVYKKDFSELRKKTFDWLKKQDLIVLPFFSGDLSYGYESILIAPKNAAFFACAVANLQNFLPVDKMEKPFKPKAIIYLAPPFRHTHFNGKQIVIHNRLDDIHELFSYNLYPGPSAKKGIYGVLLNIGEQENWTTVHASTVKVITPYENEIVLMHEGASGGGKSEMLEYIHREVDSRVLLGRNIITNEKDYLELTETCEIRPVTDDMALCHAKFQNDSKKLVVKDAEDGWFLRLDHITHYGTDPKLEKLCIHPKEPLLFLNLQGKEDSTCLIWEHILDSTGTPCPNPRVIFPRRLMPNIVNEAVEVDVRSFGVRTPPCTRENPSYGIIGLFQILPPALAWIWRLASPRGHNNPSITTSIGMVSEGVGSYWPFATGKMVKQANMLLDQIISSANTRYLLIPNQHVGAYKVGFMPQWIAREYIARRGSAKFKPEHLSESKCVLLGYELETLKVDGQYIRKTLLQPIKQEEVGVEGFTKGADILKTFFKSEIAKFNTKDLYPLGQKIINLCMEDAPLSEYLNIIPMKY